MRSFVWDFMFVLDFHWGYAIPYAPQKKSETKVSDFVFSDMSIVYDRKINENKKISRKADRVYMLAKESLKGSQSNPSILALKI